jgi:predicted enzyme related to lactoylglutathione lyase
MAAALVIACGSSAWGDGAMEDRKDPPGGFLGQVKPVLYVSDVEASAVFFRDVLGFELLSWADNEETPYYAEMAAADQKFGLHAARDEKERQRIGKQRIYFRVRSADDHRRRVSAHGARPGPIERTAWMTMFSVVDVDGHEIVFAETDPKVHSVDPW